MAHAAKINNGGIVEQVIAVLSGVGALWDGENFTSQVTE